jgi:hypothetical protein
MDHAVDVAKIEADLLQAGAVGGGAHQPQAGSRIERDLAGHGVRRNPAQAGVLGGVIR